MLRKREKGHLTPCVEIMGGFQEEVIPKFSQHNTSLVHKIKGFCVARETV